MRKTKIVLEIVWDESELVDPALWNYDELFNYEDAPRVAVSVISHETEEQKEGK